MSTLFQWTEQDMLDLLATCETDGLLPYVERYMPKPAKVLESGCGAGRYVKYLHDRGWDITGLELDKDTVKMVKKQWPELKIVLGDAADSPFKANTFDGIISLGVIEHWTQGPEAPLNDIYRTLKPGGIAIITTPCLNTVRKFKHLTWWDERHDKAAWKSWKENRQPEPNRMNKDYKYYTYPAFGDFFEYRFTKAEFRNAVKTAGLEIVEHNPSAVIDGIHHELNPGEKLTKFKNWQFQVSPLGKAVNFTLSLLPFFHPHMQLIIAKKPPARRTTKTRRK